MDVRVLLAVGLLMTTLLALAPGASASACTVGPGVDCEATVGNCDVDAGANVVTTTTAGGSVDCSFGMTRCFAGVFVGQDLLDPTVKRWCAF